jgi:hypothetical protein
LQPGLKGATPEESAFRGVETGVAVIEVGNGEREGGRLTGGPAADREASLDHAEHRQGCA